jgi:aldehyde:ferredoxin oxidoreductase
MKPKKILRINTKTKEITGSPEKDFKMGGRMLTSCIIASEVDPKTDPLGAGNKLAIAGMIPAGTTITGSYRLSVGFKSPLTGGIKESNIGGTLGYLLFGQGIKAIILEDKPEKPECNVLVIAGDGSIHFEDGSHLKEKGTYETEEILKKKFGEKVAVMSVGPAGERGYLNSAIMGTEMGIERPCRAAARGGGGAVMASKGIKAIVIQKADDPYKAEYADKDTYFAAAKTINQSAMKSPYTSAGTMVLIGTTVPRAIAPYRNFNGGTATKEEQDQYNVQGLSDRMKQHGGVTGHACQPGCVIRCSNAFHEKDGTFLTGGFEYETIELAGPNCGIFDIETVARIDRFCDDFGFDTIEFGVTLGIYLDCGKLPWGDYGAIVELLKNIRSNAELAHDFGQGAERFGKKLGAKHVPTVKGQAIAAYDPRNLKGTGTTYAISPMGADHTAGNSLANQTVVHHEKAGQLELAVNLQSFILLADSNMCVFGWGNIMKFAEADYFNALSAVFGKPCTKEEMFGMALDTLKKEVAFNRAAGIGPDQDRLPDFFYKEPSSLTGAVYDITAEEIAEKWHKLVG